MVTTTPQIMFDPAKLKLVDPRTLKKDPKNRNKHSDEQIERFAKLLDRYGMRWPILVSERTDIIKAGEGRLLAALKRKMHLVLVSYQEFDSDETEWGFGISDNAIAAWAELDLSSIQTDLKGMDGFDIDLLGIQDFELIDEEKLEPGCDEDEVPEVKESIVKLGDIWQLGSHRLMCGDSTSIDCFKSLVQDEKIELCFTSPPYADQRDYNGEKELSTEHLVTFLRTSYGSINYFAVNLGYSRKDGEVNPYWNDYIKEAKDCGLKFLSWNIWNKGSTISLASQTAMFAINHEWIFVFGKDKKVLNRTIPNKLAGMPNHNKGGGSSQREKSGKITDKVEFIVGDFKQLYTILDHATDTGTSDVDHPAKFPVGFPTAYIEAMTANGQSVYEPFAGSGSTLIACEQTGRTCLAMELDPYYCSVIIARWEKYSGKKAVLHGATTHSN